MAFFDNIVHFLITYNASSTCALSFFFRISFIPSHWPDINITHDLRPIPSTIPSYQRSQAKSSMSSFSGLPNVGSLIPSIDKAFIKFEEIPVGRKTCDVCGDYFSITGDLQDCPVGLPCGHVHCFGCTWTWLHRNHSCPECDTKYVIQPICVALKREAYLCRYQGFPPSGQFQAEPLPPPDHSTDSMDVDDDDDATITEPGTPGIKEPSEEAICLNIGPTTEETKGRSRITYMLTESRDGVFINYTCVRSGTDASTQELEAKMLPEQSHTDQESQPDSQAWYEEKLRISKHPKKLAKYYNRPFAETDSQRAERQERQREYDRKRRANQTEEERAKRLETARKWRMRRRGRETEDEREERLAKNRKGAKRST